MLFKINTSSLKFRMTAIVIFLVLLASALISIVSLYFVERRMRSVVGDQQYALLSSAAAYLDEDLESKKTLLKSLAVQLSKSSGTSSKLQEFLEENTSLRDEFFNVAIVNSAGDLVANLSDRRVIGGVNISEREYFLNTVKFKDGVISKPIKSLISSKPVILITQPVLSKEGHVIYILVGGIDLQSPYFFGQLDSLKPGLSGYLSVMTSDGTIIHHPDKKLILSRVTDTAGDAVAHPQSALQRREGWSDGTTKRGVHALMTYKRLRNTDWILEAVYPMEEAFTSLIEIRKNALIASVGVAAISGFIGWMAILKLLKPLGALRRRVAKISEGTAEIHVFDVSHNDEFGELSRAFFLLSQQRQIAEDNLASLARTDTLTGINNRRMFKEVFLAAI